jgi:DNA-binding IclR family transcriptional regulator
MIWQKPRGAMADAVQPGEKAAPAHSQTLSRGIRMLEILSEETTALSIAEISARMGVHRSIAYRILRTLEDHGLVARDNAGSIVLGTGLATLARGVARDLQTAALPELTSLANELGTTAFLVVLDRGDCTTLTSVEPRHSRAAVVQRPGTRHALNVGAPGLAIQAILDDSQWEAISPDQPRRPEVASVRELGFAVSHHEVLPGVTSVAVPLRPTQGLQPAAIAVVYPSAQLPPEQVGRSVKEAAHRISEQLR